MATTLYNRSILRQLWRTGWMVLASLFLVLWFSQSIRFIELVINRGLPFYTVLILSLQWLPSLLVILLPVSQFITVLVVLQRLIGDHEWVIWNAVGVTPAALLKPFVIFGCMGSLLLGLSNLYLLPVSYNSFRDYQTRLRDSVLTLQEGTFTNALPNVTVFVRQQIGSNQFNGLLVQDTRNALENDTIYAASGEILRTKDGVVLRVFHGTRQAFKPQTGELSLLSFEEYQLNLTANLAGGSANAEPKEAQTEAQKEAKGQSTAYLLLAKADHLKAALLRSYRAEAHQRIVGSLFPLCLTLLAYLGMTQDLRTRVGRGKTLFQIGLAGTVFMAIGYGLTALNVRNNQFIWLSYGLVLATLMLCGLWQKRRTASWSYPDNSPDPYWDSVAEFQRKQNNFSNR